MRADQVIILNCKAYPEALAGLDSKLYRACAKAAQEGIPLWVAPPTSLVAELAARGDYPVLFQAVHRAVQGSRTGWVTPLEVTSAGAVGSLVNHAENQVELRELGPIISALRKQDSLTIVCSSDVATSKAVAALGPDYVAIEPPELIGGDLSVTTADPAIVADAVAAIRSIDPGVKVLTGAGVKTGADVAKAIELGCAGVLLASGVVKAADPLAALRDLASGLPGH